MDGIRCLELYSGIGGMHFALKECFPHAEVVAAVDVNPNANKVYAHNFPDVKVLDNGIEGFSVKTLDALNFNMILMSPPCQPFTRIGLQKDLDDPRTKSLTHLISVLPKLNKPPQYILLENVKGFEESLAHEEFCRTLHDCGYNRIEFLLSPRQFGVPNSRLRYYLLAKMEGFDVSLENDGKIWECLPTSFNAVAEFTMLKQGKLQVEELETDKNRTIPKIGMEMLTRPLQHFLESDVPDEFRVSDKIKERYLNVMDIVTPMSTISTCFTKSYTHYAEATGSVLNLNVNSKTQSDISREPDSFDLRYFTPREVANLMCFPEHFKFPCDITIRQRYKMLGNSLNVKVVAYLIRLLLSKS